MSWQYRSIDLLRNPKSPESGQWRVCEQPSRTLPGAVVTSFNQRTLPNLFLHVRRLLQVLDSPVSHIEAQLTTILRSDSLLYAQLRYVTWLDESTLHVYRWHSTQVRNLPQRVLLTPSTCSWPEYRYKYWNRAVFQRGYREYSNGESRERLLIDPEGCVLETDTGNILIVIDGQWLTPDDTRRLPGTALDNMRRKRQQPIRACALTIDDVRQADELYMINAALGLVPCRLDEV